MSADISPKLSARLARARFRAWHRGTREADYIVGGFFDCHHEAWDEAALEWFEILLDEQDVDILAWALNVAEAPDHLRGELLMALQKLDYVTV